MKRDSIKVADFPEWTPPIGGWQYRWRITEKSSGNVIAAVAGDRASDVVFHYYNNLMRPLLVSFVLLPWSVQVWQSVLDEPHIEQYHGDSLLWQPVELISKGFTQEEAVKRLHKCLAKWSKKFG